MAKETKQEQDLREKIFTLIGTEINIKGNVPNTIIMCPKDHKILCSMRANGISLGSTCNIFRAEIDETIVLEMTT